MWQIRTITDALNSCQIFNSRHHQKYSPPTYFKDKHLGLSTFSPTSPLIIHAHCIVVLISFTRIIVNPDKLFYSWLLLSSASFVSLICSVTRLFPIPPQLGSNFITLRSVLKQASGFPNSSVLVTQTVVSVEGCRGFTGKSKPETRNPALWKAFTDCPFGDILQKGFSGHNNWECQCVDSRTLCFRDLFLSEIQNVVREILFFICFW